MNNEIKSEAPKAHAKKRSSGRPLLLMLLCGIAFIILCILVVDVTNSGDKIKRFFSKAPAAKPAERPKTLPPEIRMVEKIVEVPVEKIVVKTVEKIIEVKPPMPSKYIDRQVIDTAKLWNGINVVSTVEAKQGKLASIEREDDKGYQIEIKLTFTIPKPNETPEEIATLNTHLPKMLKDFTKLIENANVSPFYHHLYELKTTRIQQKATRFDSVLSRHNLYDCETVLEITHPETGRKTLLVQGDMDVVSDGSDGDRWPELDNYISMSDYYQPFTSYGWAKQTNTPNPLLKTWKERLKKAEEAYAVPGLSSSRNRDLEAQIADRKLGIADMEGRSFLIAEADPFIVVPLSFLGRKDQNEFGPAIGDYAVVIYEDKLYPAIAGDAGPSFKFGEASLRMAKALNPKANPYNRPVSDLKVTYLVFPNSADDKKGPPDLEAWHAKCSELITDLGGLGEGYQLYEWEDLIAKKRAENGPKEKTEVPEPENSTNPGADAQAEGTPKPEN